MICTKGRDSSRTVTEGRTRTGFAPKAGTAARTRELVGKEKVRGGKIKGTWWEKERNLVGKGKGPGGKRKGAWWEKERNLVGKGKGPGGKRKGAWW
jgi:hypothetical protein